MYVATTFSFVRPCPTLCWPHSALPYSATVRCRTLMIALAMTHHFRSSIRWRTGNNSLAIQSWRRILVKPETNCCHYHLSNSQLVFRRLGFNFLKRTCIISLPTSISALKRGLSNLTKRNVLLSQLCWTKTSQAK